MTTALEAWSANDEAQRLLADMGAKEAKIWALNSWEHYGALPPHSDLGVMRNRVRLVAFWKDVHTLLRLETASDEEAEVLDDLFAEDMARLNEVSGRL